MWWIEILGVKFRLIGKYVENGLALVRAFLVHDDLLKDSFGDFFKFITDVFIPSHTIPDFVATSALMVPSHLGFAEKAKKDAGGHRRGKYQSLVEGDPHHRIHVSVLLGRGVKVIIPGFSNCAT
jgi:hypothetical protein